MADTKPLKVLPDGGGDSAGLAEFVAADTIGVVDGGTGLATVAASNILTGNGTSALSAESNLTFDGTDLAIGNAAPSSYIASVHGLIIGDTGDATSEIVLATSTSGTGALNFTDAVSTANDAWLRYLHASTNHMELGVQGGTHTYFMPGPYAVMGGTDQTNANMGIGLTLNQTTYDNHILTFKSDDDVAHAMTDITETDTYGYFTKNLATYGGVSLWGYSAGAYGGIGLIANTTSPNTTKSTSGRAEIEMTAQASSNNEKRSFTG